MSSDIFHIVPTWDDVSDILVYLQSIDIGGEEHCSPSVKCILKSRRRIIMQDNVHQFGVTSHIIDYDQ